MNKTNGKIADRSRQALVKALLSVMEQYNFKEITVTQLAQEAGLSRKTFYRLFPDREAVLALYFEGIFADCFAQIRARALHHYWDVVQVYFDFWEGRRETLALLNRSNLLPALFDFAYQHSLEIFESVRSEEIVNDFSFSLPYLLAYSVGGIHSMLLKWAEDGMVVNSRLLIDTLKVGYGSDFL